MNPFQKLAWNAVYRRRAEERARRLGWIVVWGLRSVVVIKSTKDGKQRSGAGVYGDVKTCAEWVHSFCASGSYRNRS